MSGGGINGWLTNFFPFLINDELNPYCWNGNDWKDCRISKESFQYALNQVPFKLEIGHTGTKIDMKFIGGLVGVSIDANDSALTPVFAYAVVETKD